VTLWALDGQEPQLHDAAYVHPAATVIGSVVLGEDTTVWPGAVLRGDYGLIEVGARTSIQDGTVVHTTDRWPTIIGSGCVIGHNAHLEGCVVEDRCLIGSGAVVLNRATVHTGALVGAAALVPEGFVVPPGQLALGVPVKLRPLPDGMADLIAASAALYVENGKRYRRELRRID